MEKVIALAITIKAGIKSTKICITFGKFKFFGGMMGVKNISSLSLSCGPFGVNTKKIKVFKKN